MISGPMPSPGRRVTRYDRVPAGVPLLLRGGARALWGAEGAQGVLVAGLRARTGEESEGKRRRRKKGGRLWARSAARGALLRFRAGAGVGVLSPVPAGQSAAEAIASDARTQQMQRVASSPGPFVFQWKDEPPCRATLLGGTPLGGSTLQAQGGGGNTGGRLLALDEVPKREGGQ